MRGGDLVNQVATLARPSAPAAATPPAADTPQHLPSPAITTTTWCRIRGAGSRDAVHQLWRPTPTSVRFTLADCVAVGPSFWLTCAAK